MSETEENRDEARNPSLLSRLKHRRREGVLETAGHRDGMAEARSHEFDADRPGSGVPSPPHDPLKLFACSLALAGVVTLAFLAGLDGEFVSLDDPVYVTANSHIRDFSWPMVRWAFTTFEAGNWHPLTWLSLALDHRLHGLEPFGYHLTSLGFHVVNSVLAFLVFHRLTGALWRSLAVAALFGLHPLRVESVAWVAERKDVLAAFFWLLTLAAYERYARLKTAASYLLVTTAFILGLMSKAVVVTLPAVLLLLDHWPLRRLDRQAVWEKFPLFALSAGCSVLTVVAQRAGGALQLDSITLLERTANSVAAYVQYLALTVWPRNLSPWYSHPALEGPALSPWSVLWATALLLGVTALALFWRNRRPYFVVGWLWYLGTLVPMIGLFQVGRQGMADRYTYIPHLGLFLVLVWGIAELPAWKSFRLRRAGAALAAGLAVILVLLTSRQTVLWQNNLSLWSHTAERSPYSFIAHQALGLELERLERYEDALGELEKARSLRPDVAVVHFSIGAVLARKGEFEAALLHRRKAVALDPDSALYQTGLGEILLAVGQWEEAGEAFEEALVLRPGFANAHYNLGRLWLAEGRPEQAVKELRAALRLAPDSAAAHRDLKEALEMLD